MHEAPPHSRIPKVLSLAQLRELAVAVGMAEPDVGAAIAMAESGGRTQAMGDGGKSVGLWQINVEACPKEYANKDMLRHGGFNAVAANAMSNGGTNWQPWATFRNGTYKKYLPKAP